MITTQDGYAYMKADWFSDVPVSTYSDEDLKILAMILCGEAQSLPDEEQRLVGSVFLNRVKSNKFPNTFAGVATQRGQYACTMASGKWKYPPGLRCWSERRKAWYSILED